MLAQRLVLGLVLILGVVLGVLADTALDAVAIPEPLAGMIGHRTLPPGTLVFAVVVTLSALAAAELAAIFRAKGIQTAWGATIASAWLGLAVSSLVPEEGGGLRSLAIASSAAIAVLLGSLAYYSRRQSSEGVVAAAGASLLAFVYLGLMFGFVVAIRREHSAWVLLWALAATKACDIGAYFTGRVLGRHKLIRWLSPGKTWEGLGGGLLTSAAVGALGAALLTRFDPAATLDTAIGAVIGLALGFVGQAGDLVASLLKRDAGLKDSGSGLPGFGGWIDVLDSPLLAMPVAYWLLAILSG